MPNTEQEIRKYLKKLPYNKRTRCKEHMLLRDIVDTRHSLAKMTCDNCGHRCHVFAEFSRCHTGGCACNSCYCNRCDLEYGNGAKAC